MISLMVLVALAGAPDAGNTMAALKLEGPSKSAELISTEQLSELGSVVADWVDKSGAHRVTGVRLDRLLARLAYDEGPTGPQAAPKVKHRGVRGVIVATAADGYEAVFSVGELQETLGATTALVVWEMDGKSLPPNVGPLRLVVTTDKRPTR